MKQERSIEDVFVQLVKTGHEYEALIQAYQTAEDGAKLGISLNILLLRITMVDLKLDLMAMHMGGGKPDAPPRIIVPKPMVLLLFSGDPKDRRVAGAGNSPEGNRSGCESSLAAIDKSVLAAAKVIADSSSCP